MDLHVFPIPIPLPPSSPSHPSGSSQCTSPEHLSHASSLDWRSVSHLIISMFRCCSWEVFLDYLSKVIRHTITTSFLWTLLLPITHVLPGSGNLCCMHPCPWHSERRGAQMGVLSCCAVLSRSVVSDSAIPWTVAHQASLSMGFSSQEYWSGLPCPPGDLPNPGIEPRSPTLQADSLPSEPPGKPKNTGVDSLSLLQGIFRIRNQPGSPALQVDSLPAELPGNP